MLHFNLQEIWCNDSVKEMLLNDRSMKCGMPQGHAAWAAK